MMTNNFLHREIREKGGAYGGGSGYSPLGGLVQMMSYRDPQIERTVETYERAVDWAMNLDQFVGQRELDEAKLNVFQVILPSLLLGKDYLKAMYRNWINP